MPLDDVATRRLWELAEANDGKAVAWCGDDISPPLAPVVALHRTSEHPWVRRFRRNVALDRLVLRRQATTQVQVRSTAQRQSRPRQTRRVTRAGSSRDGPSRSDDDSESPKSDLGRLAAVSVRLWAHEMRRLARQKVAE
jgi:hypothetical protein